MGTEFVLLDALCKEGDEKEPSIYVIEKRFRKSRTETCTISVYFIVDGYITQAPTLKRVLDARTYNASICI